MTWVPNPLKGVYLLHFDQPYKQARHYIGWSQNIDLRLAKHLMGTGARLMQVLYEQKIGFQVAKIWKDENRTFERSLKNKKNTPRICPICQELKKKGGEN